MNIGERIRKIREDHKETQKMFAAHTGITVRMLSYYENNESFPPADILAKIASYCKVSLDYIFFGKDDVLSKRFKISDSELLELFQKADKLEIKEKDRIKWAIKALMDKTN